MKVKVTVVPTGPDAMTGLVMVTAGAARAGVAGIASISKEKVMANAKIRINQLPFTVYLRYGRVLAGCANSHLFCLIINP